MPEAQLQIVVIASSLFIALLALLRLTRRREPTRGRPIALTPAHHLHVVEIEGRRLLVGTGSSGPPQMICELEEQPAWSNASFDGWKARDAG